MPDLQITMANLISTSATQTALSIEELVTTMRASGMANVAIKQTLLNDLNSGGQLFGAFRNKIKNTVKNGVEFSSNGSANGSFTKAGVQEFKWISVGDNKVCPDCEGRHGETGTMEFFETIGLPASGFSVCTTNCRCQLVPANYKGENLDKPLVKGDKNVFIQKKKTIEKSILKATGNKREMGVLMDSKGNELFRKKGTKSHVNITKKDLSNIDTKNTIFTHNHPNSLSFSLNDILFAGELGLKEIRAIAPNSSLGSVVFKIRPKAGVGWPNSGKIRSAFNALKTKHLGKRAINKWLENTDDGLIWKSKLDDVIAKREVLNSKYRKKEISLDEYDRDWKKSKKEWRKIAAEAQEDFSRKISGDFAQLQKELANELGMVMEWEAL